jgi:hypothetical protein
MGNRSAQRVGAATGPVFVVLTLLSAFIYPQQPRIDSPAATTIGWAHEHRVALQVGMILGLFAAGLLLWFVCNLQGVVDRGGPDTDSFGPMVFGAGIAVAIVSALAALPIALLAFMEAQPGGITDPSIVRLLGDLNQVLFAVSSLMTGVFALALGLSVLRGELRLPSWIGGLSVVVAALNGVAVWVAVTFSSYHGKGWNVVAFGAFIGFLVVVLSTSVALLRRDGAPAPAPSTAP